MTIKKLFGDGLIFLPISIEPEATKVPIIEGAASESTRPAFKKNFPILLSFIFFKARLTLVNR